MSSREGLRIAYLYDLLKQLENNAIQGSVLEATLAGLGQRRTNGKSDNDIVRVLLGAAKETQ